MMERSLIHSTAVIDDGSIIGEGTRVWHFSHVMAGAVIGNDCVIGQNVFIAAGVKIGNGVKIQNNVSIFTGVTCEDDVFLGPSVVFTNVINPRSFIERKTEFRQTLIKKGASIGANATVICGNNVGAYAMIGAGSVISKPIPDYALVYGNPSRQHGWCSKNGNKLQFIDMVAHCDSTGEKYILEDGKVRIADERED